MFVTVQFVKHFRVGLINLGILLLKMPNLSEFRMLGSSSFHSMNVDGNKVLLRK